MTPFTILVRRGDRMTATESQEAIKAECARMKEQVESKMARDVEALEPLRKILADALKDE